MRRRAPRGKGAPPGRDRTVEQGFVAIGRRCENLSSRGVDDVEPITGDEFTVDQHPIIAIKIHPALQSIDKI